MSVLTSIAALRSLCGLHLAPAVLVPAVLEALHQVVPSARNLFDATDPQGKLLRYWVEGPLDAKVAQLYFEEFHNKREAEAMAPFHALHATPAGVRGADELDHPAFFNSALYAEIWRPQGFHTRLEGVVRARDGRLLGSLVLYRERAERPFSRADEKRLGAFLPVLAAALDGQTPHDHHDDHVPSPQPEQTLLLDAVGNLLHSTPAALGLLLAAQGGIAPLQLNQPYGDQIGALLRLLLHRLHGLRSLPESPLAQTIVNLELPAGALQARAQWLTPHQPGQPPLALVGLRRLEPHRVALERALRELPLTPGQRAVCRALYQGGTQQSVALRLGVATATVIDHVRKLYRALELNSVAELRSLIDARIAHSAQPG